MKSNIERKESDACQNTTKVVEVGTNWTIIEISQTAKIVSCRTIDIRIECPRNKREGAIKDDYEYATYCQKGPPE
jgi:hypothetical protein